jgi:hypothetical protein
MVQYIMRTIKDLGGIAQQRSRIFRLNMLRTSILLAIHQLCGSKQDGASPHYHPQVTVYLDDI